MDAKIKGRDTKERDRESKGSGDRGRYSDRKKMTRIILVEDIVGTRVGTEIREYLVEEGGNTRR